MTVQELIDSLIVECGSRSPSETTIVVRRMVKEDYKGESWAFMEEAPPEVESHNIYPFPFNVVIK